MVAKANGSSMELPDQLPLLPDDWHYQALGDLVNDHGICYGIVQPGSHCIGGIPIVRVNNIRNGRIDTADVLRVESDIEEKYRRSRLRGGEILLTLVGTLGEVAIAPGELAGWNVARAVGVIPVKSIPGSRWVVVCLRSQLSQHLIRTWATTTVQATFNLRDLARLPIPIPPASLRERITHILGILDDKIELNRRMNETLEAIAQAIFKSWFVDFDPVRVLSGQMPQKPPFLTAEALRKAGFSDRLQASALGEIPEGWQSGCISDLGAVICGKTPPTSDAENYGTGIPFVTIPDMHGKVLVTDTERSLSAIGAATQPTKTLPPYAICVSCIATIGLVALTSEPCQTNQQINSVVPSESHTSFYCYFALRDLVHEIQSRGSGGSVVLNLNKTQFASLPVLLPSRVAEFSFKEIVRPIFEKILANIYESRTLAALRDALLPKLLSGELQPKEAARYVDAVI
jgi:type I restriction enzyme S subunit